MKKLINMLCYPYDCTGPPLVSTPCGYPTLGMFVNPSVTMLTRSQYPAPPRMLVARNSHCPCGTENLCLSEAGFFLSGKNSSKMVIGGALGDMLMPALIATLMGPGDGLWSAALYVVCVVISVLMLLVYGICCGLLKRTGRHLGQGEGGL